MYKHVQILPSMEILLQIHLRSNWTFKVDGKRPAPLGMPQNTHKKNDSETKPIYYICGILSGGRIFSINSLFPWLFLSNSTIRLGIQFLDV